MSIRGIQAPMLPIWAIVCGLLTCGFFVQAGGSASPSEEAIGKADKAFRELKRPIGYDVVREDGEVTITLNGATRRFAEGVSTQTLVFALWRYIDDSSYEADAVIILEGRLRSNISSTIGGVNTLTYRDTASQGNWPTAKQALKRICRSHCRSALGESDEWYPHRVLFTNDKVLEESKRDPAVRAKYIAEMQKALADPKIRTENPLEAMNILNILSTLNAKEAVGTFVDYLFFDWKTGTDYRIRLGDSFSTETFAHVPGCTVGLAQLGDSATPLILKRIAQSTPEERSMAAGGGGAPVFVICYFYCQRKTQKQAIDAIAEFKRDHPDLTETQTGALDEIAAIIEKKQYRPYFFRGEWASPPPTNAVPGK